MKKYINKLFEWLGYVPKDTYKTAREYAAIKLRLRQAISEHQKSSLGLRVDFALVNIVSPQRIGLLTDSWLSRFAIRTVSVGLSNSSPIMAIKHTLVFAPRNFVRNLTKNISVL